MKHKMQVVPAHGTSHYMPGWVFFICENCGANVSIERPVWYNIVINGDERLKRSVTGTWRICRGNR